jgi:hypothetical protein
MAAAPGQFAEAPGPMSLAGLGGTGDFGDDAPRPIGLEAIGAGASGAAAPAPALELPSAMAAAPGPLALGLLEGASGSGEMSAPEPMLGAESADVAADEAVAPWPRDDMAGAALGTVAQDDPLPHGQRDGDPALMGQFPEPMAMEQLMRLEDRR